MKEILSLLLYIDPFTVYKGRLLLLKIDNYCYYIPNFCVMPGRHSGLMRWLSSVLFNMMHFFVIWSNENHETTVNVRDFYSNR